jgi:AraC family transcriptional activator of pobA
VRPVTSAAPPLYGPVNPGPMRPPLEVCYFDRSHPRVAAGTHAHHDLEILYFQAGSGTHRMGQYDLEISPGALFLVPPKQIHDLARIGDAQGWSVEFSPSAMATLPEVAGSLPLWRANPLLSAFLASEQEPSMGRLTVPPQRQSVVEHLLTEMQYEVEVRDAGFRVASAAQVVLLLVHVARLAADVTAQYRMNHEPLLAKCFDIIEKNFRGTLSTTDVAEAANVSSTHLASLVKQRTGKTVLDWITERRMSEARQLLLSTDLSIEAIGRRPGFHDPTYFSRRFRQLHGASPRAWRDAASS